MSSKPVSKPDRTPIQVTYTSNPVAIPDSFLASPSAQRVTFTPVAFAEAGLPEYASKTALVLKNVLSPSECVELIALAEASVPTDEYTPAESSSSPETKASPWRPALVAVAPGWEAPAPGYRESDRIVWNEQTVVDRIWSRCVQAEGLVDLLSVVPAEAREGKAHCDGPTWIDSEEGEFQTHYTMHIFLNDSAAESPSGEGVVGGATAFLSRDRKRRLDVNLKAGSVLIFQHSGLLHEGALVTEGHKYTVRTDIMYQLIKGQ